MTTLGAGNVARAFAVWGHLPDRDLRLLLLMALTSLDEPNGVQPARHYFGGRDHLALGLGREPALDPEAYRAVKRTIARLVDAGAITRTRHAHTGSRQVYLLNLDSSRNSGETDRTAVDMAVDNVLPFTREGAT